MSIWRDPELRIPGGLLILTLAAGTVAYMVFEGWSLFDALYFSVVTLATVGYGDMSPHTTAGKAVTIVYIICGIGVLATFANVIARKWVDHRLHRLLGPAPPGYDARTRATRYRRLARRGPLSSR